MGQTLPVRHTGGAISLEQVRELERKSRRENLGRAWYKFSRNSLSLVGSNSEFGRSREADRRGEACRCSLNVRSCRCKLAKRSR
jgi:hypothetical protein